jgi:enoyl-CoA hydratase/carnithine racemase
MSTSVTYGERLVDGCTIGDLHLSSPDGLNPLSTTAVATLRDELERLNHRDPPRVLTLTSSGRAFSAGANLKEIQAMTPEEFGGFMTDILALFQEMIGHAKPIVAVVHGDALGGGAALAQFSDLVVAAEGARFGFPEALRGLAAPGYLTPRLLGRQRAAELALTGRFLSAREMFELGQVNAVCATEELPATVEAFLKRIAATNPTSLALGKRSLRNGLIQDLTDAMGNHVQLQIEALREARRSGLI